MSAYNNAMRRQRRGGPVVGTRRGGGRSAPDKSLLQEGIYINERFLHAFASCIGCLVQVRVRNGKVYEGILRTTSPQLKVVLERVHVVEAADSPQDRIVSTVIFDKNDIVMITVPDVNLDYAVIDGFTDAAITKCNGTVREKELQPWEADSSAEIDSLEGIEEGVSDGRDEQGWDPNEMFSTNAEKFNIKSDYDPNLSQYTTPLHRSDTQEFRQREARAQQLAMEIEHGIDHAKRAALENSDNEEMMFSAVHRPTPNSAGSASSTNNVTPMSANNGGKYLAPHLRNSAVVTPAQRPQQLVPNSATAAVTPSSSTVTSSSTDSRIEPCVNGMDIANDDDALPQPPSVTSGDHATVVTDRDSSTVSPQPVKTSGSNVVDELKEFQSNFKLTDSVTQDRKTPVPLASNTVVSTAPFGNPVDDTLANVSQSSVHLQPAAPVQPTVVPAPPATLHHPVVQPSVMSPQVSDELAEDKATSSTEEQTDVAKKSNLNPLAKEFNPSAKQVPRAVPATTPPRPLSVPPSPVSAFPGPMAAQQVMYPHPPVLVPVQQAQHGTRLVQANAQNKRVTVSARGTGEMGIPPAQSTVGPPLMTPPMVQLGQGHLAYQQPHFILPQGVRFLVQQPIMNMGPSHDLSASNGLSQMMVASSQPGMYLAQYPQHAGGPQPPQMVNHSQSTPQPPNHVGGPQQSASSGHQTPTPAQHSTQYAMQQVGPMVSGMTPHMYHAVAMQHSVVASQPGQTPQSPQVAYATGPIPLHYTHQNGNVTYVSASQPQQLGPPPTQSGGLPPAMVAAGPGHLMITQQMAPHPTMHTQAMMTNQPGVPAPAVAPPHQYVQAHPMQGPGAVIQGHPGQHVMNTAQVYATVPPHQMPQGQPYQHSAQ